MQQTQADSSALNALIEQAAQALQQGREETVFSLWNEILARDPNNVPTLTMIGRRAFRLNDFAAAKASFKRVVDADGSDPEQWINLALTYRGLKDEQGEEVAIKRALTVEPSHLVALILKADLLERQGRQHEAAKAYGAVTAVAPPVEKLAPNLRPCVTKAMSFKEKYQTSYGNFMDDFLESHYQSFHGEDLNRFKDSLDIFLGRKKRYESASMLYHYPGLLPVEFFERDRFPWLAPIEESTDLIRDEFLAVLESEEGFTPYLTYSSDQPLNQFAELNNSPRWSAYHLLESGVPVADNVAKCPLTMAQLANVPQPDQPGRTPSAMFSLLKPKTKIPPHVGVSNVRLVVHVPLILPENCGFRVGNQSREWELGTAFVFDDTIEHEAWNNSDKLRVVLIFDIWHPDLTEAERAMITALTKGSNAFTSSSASLQM